MTFPLRGLASPAALLLCILPALSCDELPAPPEPEPLAPVLRVTELHWVVRDAAPESLDLYAEAALDAAATGLTLGGELAPALPSDGSPENPALVAGLSAALSALTEGGPELALGVEVAALGSDAPETLCFSPAEPESDPYLVTRSAALEAVLQAHPEITSLSVDLAAAPAPWDVDCSCADCEGGGASAQAARLVASFGALERAAQGFGLTPWWWDRLQSPGSDGLNASSVMDTALTELRPESELRVRVAPVRGQGGPWASPNPRLSDGLSRPTSVDLDLAGAAYGPTDALILLPRELHDTVMRARQLGATAWFASVDGGGRGILSRPERANGWFAGELFRNLGARPSELLADWASQEWGIDASSEIGAELVDALDESGRALALTTHPLGLPVRNLDQGLGTLPLTYVDPRPWSDDWTERWEELGSPTQQTLVDVNQWGSEGVALSQAALEAFTAAESSLSAADASALREALTVLHASTRAWKHTTGADVALDLWQREPTDELASWLRDDAAALDSLADEVEAATSAGTISNPFPAEPTALRQLADQIQAAVGSGPAAERPFPTITDIHWSFEEDRAYVNWELRPGGSGWWQWGEDWPVYDQDSETGEGPAAYWHGWTTRLDAETRVVFRTCGQSAGYSVCSSDNVLWTPR